jgi:hypothetical protein
MRQYVRVLWPNPTIYCILTINSKNSGGIVLECSSAVAQKGAITVIPDREVIHEKNWLVYFVGFSFPCPLADGTSP